MNTAVFKKTHFSLFFRKWIDVEEKDFLAAIVKRLNQGETLFDVSGEFVKKREQASFAFKLQLKLEDLGYSYDTEHKRWLEKDDQTSKNNSIDNPMFQVVDTALDATVTRDIVTYLNEGHTMKQAEVKFQLVAPNIRNKLKHAGYRYDNLFNIWTVEERTKLVKLLAEKLQNEEISFEELEKRGMKVDKLKEEFEKINFPVNVPQAKELSQPIAPLSTTEIEIFRKMIGTWESQTSVAHNLSITINHELLQSLEDVAKNREITLTQIVEEALAHYLKEMK
ncbi:hypothetical protein DS745_03775 [Anaerobacillus alkaliphilus]|uniref:Uncharacterized protein n=1 Tax=Anaerobacillus alkaliphilus TaxID=1548597 RepID=A0A4Q0VYP7_9BACI|nr:hypothetical protein [Anaerobacillus alkaliphilus]RXJ04512.1 hypothetical protein DS745_03775 [Anaerobacillus alkaliphilus]